jgi:DNA (cytosine-5)-methyltransferase 1
MFCENEPAAAAVLAHRFQSPWIYEDVRTLTALPEATNLVAAGFPCQDLSQAGLTRGIKGKQSGLVGEVFRLLRQQPTEWVLLENVPFMLQLRGGKALDTIVSALEEMGYNWAYRVIDTRSFGLPQRRQRVILIASRSHDPREVILSDDAGEPMHATAGDDTHAFGFYWTEGNKGLGLAIDAVPTLKGGSTIGIPSPPAILMPSGKVVTPDIRDAERLQGFPPDWSLAAEDVVRPALRWKLVGNAVTVDLAAWVGQKFRQPRPYDDTLDTRLARSAKWPRAAWNVDGKRYRSVVSAWPVHEKMKPIHKFLKFKPKPLSARAAAGFAARLGASTLRTPPGFLARVEAHRDQMFALATT